MSAAGWMWFATCAASAALYAADQGRKRIDETAELVLRTGRVLHDLRALFWMLDGIAMLATSVYCLVRVVQVVS